MRLSFTKRLETFESVGPRVVGVLSSSDCVSRRALMTVESCNCGELNPHAFLLQGFRYHQSKIRL